MLHTIAAVCLKTSCETQGSSRVPVNLLHAMKTVAIQDTVDGYVQTESHTSYNRRNDLKLQKMTLEQLDVCVHSKTRHAQAHFTFDM